MLRKLLTVAILAGPCALVAQEPGRPPVPGIMVRLTRTCGAGAAERLCMVQGTLLGLRADSLFVAGPAFTTVVSQTDLRRFEASAGRRGHARVGALVGLVVGAGAATVVLRSGGSTAPCNSAENQDAMSSGECLGLTAAVAAAGVGLGALVGSMIRAEHWQQVPLERVRMTLQPGPSRGVQLALRLAF